jgi:thiamine-monophosphate kinase
MSLGEFELIDRYFRPLASPDGSPRDDVALGIGDDGALLRAPADAELVMVLDTLVSGRHFLPGSDPHSIAHRALAVNLSDLAAMGAMPAWAMLGLSLPEAQPTFLQRLAAGWLDLARLHHVSLIGGDTTKGPLCLTVQLTGFVPPGRALRRAGGSAGDVLFVSGSLGDAAAGLAVLQSRLASKAGADALVRRLEYPTPRVALGLALRGIASACIDVSDGLTADAHRLAAASGCGLELDVEALPLSAALREVAGVDAAREFALGGGDDYELLFAVPESRLDELAAASAGLCDVTRIGRLEGKAGLRLREPGSGRILDSDPRGYDHFKA